MSARQPDPVAQVMFRLPKSVKRRLMAKLAAEGKTLVDFFREAVERYLKEQK
jgi:predicted DNA-binding protein